MASLIFPPRHPAGTVRLTRSPFRVGSAADNDLVIRDPAIRSSHLTLIEREYDWLLVPGEAAKGLMQIDGRPLLAATPVSANTDLTLSAGLRVRFAIMEEAPAASSRRAPAEPAPVSFSVDPELVAARRRASAAKRRTLLWTSALVIVLAVGGFASWRLTRSVDVRGAFAQVDQPLSEAESRLFDDLLSESYDHMERGIVLLDAGASEAALNEFAQAVNTLQSSQLRNNAWLQPRIIALEAKVGDIYRNRRLSVPTAYSTARARAILALRSSVSTADFSSKLRQMQLGFSSRWAREVTVTGTDHAEHVSLYGAGGAVDLRVRDLSEEQRRWVVTTTRRLGLRVKDFSDDQVLQDQIRRARAAGVPERAGTGLHLHVDRFPDRSDRYTVR